MNFDGKKIVEWAKANMSLVITGAVSLVMVILAVFYLLHGMAASTQAALDLDQAKSQLNSLQSQDPYPNDANVKFMQDETVKLQAMLEDFGEKFAPLPVPPETYTASGFKYELENMVSTLTEKAKNLSIQLPTNRVNFSFSFSAQRANLRMDTNSLKIQAEQLAHVKYLCNSVMDSGISEFIRVRRAAGATNDLFQVSNYLADYLPARQIITNKYSFAYPYELVFKTSPGDLAKFINTLVECPYGIIIKCIKVERASSEMTDELADYQETPIINMRGRGNMRGMRMPVQPQVQEQTKTAEEAEMEKALPKVTTTVLKPTALRVTMYVDVMRLKSQAEAAAIAAAEQEHLKATATDIDGDGTLDIDENGNTLPGASMDKYGNKLDPATGQIIQQ